MAIFQPDDLIDDRSLNLIGEGSEDQLGHTAIAAQVAELAMGSPGHVNIAVYGPWGAGKSSLFELIAQQLRVRSRADVDTKVEFILFDAWKNAGSDFSVNFLSAIAEKRSDREKEEITRSLFDTRRTLSLPFGLSNLSMRSRLLIFAAVFVIVVAVIPVLWIVFRNSWDFSKLSLDGYIDTLRAWLGLSVGSTVLLLIGAIGVDLTRVSVEQSAPSHIAQFRKLFDRLVGKSRFIVFIDELDRCSPEQLMQTLEGMRTFLGHENVVFVAAFDRAAVATTISESRKKALTATPSDAAYYRTAGEYLDKIFQYQLSLPPQSGRTIRRFALENVLSRGGIWADLRGSGDLETVVSLLSPAHIRSPRRTKVLLNDFVINARDYELLVGEDWRGRAREIAVWTVIQTEFPNLASDMITEPDLPAYLIEQADEPARASFASLVNRYREKNNDLDSGNGQPEVRERQHDDLVLYLERVSSLGIPFPAADLVWRTSSANADAFDDQGLVRVLSRAADTTTRTTTTALIGASENDLILAVDFLAHEVEQEFVAESLVLARTIGELAEAHEVVRSRRGFAVSQVWNRVSVLSAGWNSLDSAMGFARVLGSIGESRSLTKFLSQLQADGLPESAAAVAAAIGAVPDERWQDSVLALGESALAEISSDARPIAEILRREDRSPSGWLESAVAGRAAALLTVEDATHVVPERNSASIAAATEQNLAADLEVAAKRDQAVERVHDILNSWPTLSGHGPARLWILALLRHLEAQYPPLGNTHDDLLRRVAEDQSVEDIAVLTLAAIEAMPASSIGRWTPPTEKINGHFDLTSVLTDLVSLIADNPSAASGVADQLSAIGAAFGAEENPGIDQVAELLSSLDVEPGVAHAKEGLAALAVLASTFGSEAAATLYTSKMVELLKQTNPANLADQLELLETATSPLLKELDAHLRAEIGEIDDDEFAGSFAAVLLEINSRQRATGGLGTSRLPVALIRRATRSTLWPDIVPDWLTTGPTFKQVDAFVPSARLTSITAPIWQQYGHGSGTGNATAAWRKMLSEAASRPVLKAIASGGVEADLYLEAGNRIVQGRSDAERAGAFDTYLTLPQDSRAAAVGAINVLQGLRSTLGGPRSGDFKYVAELALLNERKFTARERSTAKGLLTSFRAPLFGSTSRTNMLRRSGLL